MNYPFRVFLFCLFVCLFVFSSSIVVVVVVVVARCYLLLLLSVCVYAFVVVVIVHCCCRVCFSGFFSSSSSSSSSFFFFFFFFGGGRVTKLDPVPLGLMFFCTIFPEAFLTASCASGYAATHGPLTLSSDAWLPVAAIFACLSLFFYKALFSALE